MKLLLLLLSFILPLATQTVDVDEIQNQFLDSVEYNYEYYNIYDSIDNSDFSILIVKGIYHNKPSYGISFVTAEKNSFYVVIETVKESYCINESSNVQSALALDATNTYQIVVYDKNDKEVKLSNNLVLNKFSVNDYDKFSSNVISGEGHGMVFTSLIPYAEKLSYIKVLLYVLGGSIIIIVVILIFLAINKRGMFNAEKRKEGVVSMRELLSQDTPDIGEQDLFKDYVPIEEQDVKVIPESQKYNKEESEESVAKITDIKAYLTDLGFITDYSALSEEEKNKIMLELIKLKNEGSITLKAYYSESYELWKK